ncbi:16S rRNA (cytidine(1402)-2'-O)-methyltransferase [Limobrevibacterium gyesilva]|uniref:Ribosomal RNA small subunit methyltransferase I n=1 Tax=Limobrevibacterium gyesilva TaxID=2991712 RepID=A0AA41YLA1_9PROT|nr:16S rRNA (cytidine(1402)-2'-O)-methyltransferase [Limobrevibacterium gyesilva]MCW3474735.1 16S rRNA (cytidine(1402)-2'-O)-methyltransferase [Limobrevibacterium gyesilva]
MTDEACDLPPDETAPGLSAPPDGLVLVSTPIGNLGDMTARAVAALKAADLVLCEDTRVTARLFSAYGIATRLTALHEHNEDTRIASVLAMLRQGKRVALVSDAGTPLVSDPGYRLVRAALAEGLPVGGVPGANAALLALTLSGLPPQPFLFLGFPPPRQAARLAAFARLRAAERAGLSATMLWYEAPHRLAEALADMAQIFGDRPAAVARELTKRFEEIRRGTLAELAGHYAAQAARGEITIAMGPAPEEATDADDLDTRLRTALDGHSLKEAVAVVTAATGLPRKQVYARALALAAG